MFATKVTLKLLSPSHDTFEWPSVPERVSLMFRLRKVSAASEIVSVSQN